MARQSCFNKLEVAKQQLLEKDNQYKMYNETIKSENQDKQSKIKQIEEALIIEVHKICWEALEKLQQQEQQNQLEKGKTIFEFESLQKELVNFSSNIDIVQKICQLDVKKIVEKEMKQKIVPIEDKVQINQEIYEEINHSLKKLFAPIKLISREQFQSQIQIKQQQQQQLFSQNNNNYSSPPNQVLQPQAPPISMIEQKMSNYKMLIDMPDYFLGQGYLHFFEGKRQRLNIFPLSLLQERNTCFQTILVNTTFEIPAFHKSISLPNGDLLLVGGTLSNETKSLQIYKFDFKLNTLNTVGRLQVARSSHTLCYLNHQVYVLGGFDTNQQAMIHCERFSPKSNFKTEAIAPLNIACASFSVTTFNDNTIYKFGGVCNGELCQIIEKYNLKTNSWIIIDPKVWIDQVIEGNSFGIYSMSVAAQINQEQMLICGGYNEEGESVDQTFIFQDIPSQEQQIKSVNWKRLPVKEGFWNNQAINYQGQIVILQNVVDDNALGEDCREDARRVLVFDGKKWFTHSE